MATYVKDARTGYQSKITDVDAAIAAHEAAVDPHPTYLTDAEGDAAYSAIGHDHDSDYAPLTHNHDADYADIAHTHTLNDLTDVVLTAPSNGQVLKYNGSTWVNDTDATGGGGALDDLSDVTITSPATGSVLTYNGSAWVDDAIPSSALNDLSDVTITAPSTGEVLKYNGSAWVNDTDSTGSSGPTSYSDYIVNYGYPGCVIYCPCDETSGTTADNLGTGGSSSDGTYQNTPTLNQTSLLNGSEGASVLYNGTDEYLSIPLPSGYFSTNSGEASIFVTAFVKMVSSSQKGIVLYAPYLTAGTPTYGAVGVGIGSGNADTTGSYIIGLNESQAWSATTVPWGTGVRCVTIGYANGSSMLAVAVDGALIITTATATATVTSGMDAKVYIANGRTQRYCNCYVQAVSVNKIITNVATGVTAAVVDLNRRAWQYGIHGRTNL